MNTVTLFRNFSSALIWNALCFFFTKSISTVTTFLLYRALSSSDFSTWGMINSFIFLFLLWADCGLRKSIPAYAPFFNRHHTFFLTAIILVQSAALILFLPFLFIFLSGITTSYFLSIIAVIIYFTEGINTIMGSLYHAYFHHRFFNQLLSVCALGESGATIIAIYHYAPDQLLPIIFIIKSLFTTIFTCIIINQWKHQPKPPFEIPHTQFTYAEFVKHTSVMYVTTILMSISERNFLLPFIASTTEGWLTNIFKIANDGALFFYRCIVKTIGFADITLLTHARATPNNHIFSQNVMQQSINQLSTQITRLALPLLGVLGIVIFFELWKHYDPFVFHAFLIMAIGYIVETIWIPYERLIEIQRNYSILYKGYGLYSIGVIALFILFYNTLIGFLTFLIGIHSVRLVIGIYMRYSVHHIYTI